ncbi:MAG TPA: cyclopropane-fatty-acyl-phospholipid synthase family protein [Solirubrobacterales bacterium]|nr:cyclopropane-fatty-acyl-phospholipid synthase family protein [Solirubrobacterales bacterium]
MTTAAAKRQRVGDAAARAGVGALLDRVRSGRINVVEGARERSYGPAGADLRATVTINDPAAWRGPLRGSVGLGEAYVDGLWETDDLVALVQIAARELRQMDGLRGAVARPRGLWHRVRHLVPENTRPGARRNISAHYDLGNDLFAAFLDERMMYSCAYFPDAAASLEEAQLAKLDRICERLRLGPENHLLEIGTGWGGMAMHAARRSGCRVTTTTISREQFELARARVRDAGLEDQVTVLLQDYRDLRGRFDRLVSVEMIEAVGWQYFDDYFRRCDELLSGDGLMLLQAITIDDRAYEVEKASRSFIKEHIFPAGCLPSVEVISRCLARVTDMRVVGLEDITAGYPETLAAWRKRFLANADRLGELGYDRRFRRLWALYLCWCEGGFRERRIGDVQVLAAKPRYRGDGRRARRTAAPGLATA